jgi:peptidoglycan/LPS O-acetylase OafA/YrhL
MRKTELPALTGSRFYAALIVFLSHAALLPGMERMTAGKLIFNAGVVGVSCFFVLSGFILTYNYEVAFRDGVCRSSYFRFVWDRWTKIYPAHLLMLLVAIPLQIKSPNLPLDWRALPFHVLMAQCWWPVTRPTFHQYLNVPSWSISCEWFFYLVAPFAIYCALNRGKRWIPAALIALYALGMLALLRQGRSDFERLYLVSWFAPSRFPEFLTGVFLGCIFLGDRGRRLARWSGAMQVVGVMVLVSGAIYRAKAPWPFWGGLLYVPGASLLVLGLAYGKGLYVRHLSGAVLRRLGMASFCLYLMQAPLLRGMKGVWMQRGWQVETWTSFWIVMILLFVSIQTAALFVHIQYELRLQKLLRTWIRRGPAQQGSGAVLRAAV